MKYIEIITGDRWNDGHGQFERFAFLVNEVELFDSARAKMVETFGYNFSEINSEYEDNKVPQDLIDKMKEKGINTDNFITDGYGGYPDYEPDGSFIWDSGDESFIDAYIECLRVCEPTLEIQNVVKARSVQLGGYGLYNS